VGLEHVRSHLKGISYLRDLNNVEKGHTYLGVFDWCCNHKFILDGTCEESLEGWILVEGSKQCGKEPYVFNGIQLEMEHWTHCMNLHDVRMS
jgi:hypothetical protein